MRIRRCGFTANARLFTCTLPMIVTYCYVQKVVVAPSKQLGVAVWMCPVLLQLSSRAASWSLNRLSFQICSRANSARPCYASYNRASGFELWSELNCGRQVPPGFMGNGLMCWDSLSDAVRPSGDGASRFGMRRGLLGGQLLPGPRTGLLLPTSPVAEATTFATCKWTANDVKKAEKT